MISKSFLQKGLKKNNFFDFIIEGVIMGCCCSVTVPDNRAVICCMCGFVLVCVSSSGHRGARSLRDERGGAGRREEVRGRRHREGEPGYPREDPQEPEAGPLERKCSFGKVTFLLLFFAGSKGITLWHVFFKKNFMSYSKYNDTDSEPACVMWSS